MGEIGELSLRQGTKRKHLQSPKKGKEDREPKTRAIKPKPMPKPTKTSTLSPFISLEQHLQEALESLKQAYIGLEEEEKKEQVKELGNYIQYILQGENPFIKEKENKEADVLKGLVEEVRTLYRKIAPIKETYAEKLKKNPPSSSTSFSSSSSISISSIPSSSSPSSRSSTRGKKKQL